MRAIRLTSALLILSATVVLALGELTASSRLMAQVSAQPGPAPLTPPAAPGQPASFATIGALPALAPAPGTFRAALATPQPTPRVFRCTCSSPGTWTQWAGSVTAPSYILARESASGQCANFNINSNAPSPYIAQAASPFAQRPTLYNGTAFTARSQIATSVGGSAVSASRAQIAAQCSQCACN
jgi:hypothetical protein